MTRLSDIFAAEPGAGHKSNVLGQKTRCGQKGRDLGGDFGETVLRPVNCVKFVDDNNETSDAHAANQKCVFFRLSFKAGFKTAGAGVNDEDGEIGLASTSDHVGNKVPVAWGVEDGEVGLFGLELVGGNVDCDASVSLLGAVV